MPITSARRSARTKAAAVAERWRAGFPPAGAWWRHSQFEALRAARAGLLRPRRWLTSPILTWSLWLALPRLSPRWRETWNRETVRRANADPLLRTLDTDQRRAAVCFEDRTLVTAGAGSGKTRTMVARAAYATRRLGADPKSIAFVTFTKRATQEIRERTVTALPGLEIGTIHQLARRVIKIVDDRTVQLSPLAEDETAKQRMIREWLESEVRADASLLADKQLRRNALRRDVEDGRAVDAFRAPPGNVKLKSHGEVVIATLLAAAKVPYVYEASFPIPRGHETGLRDYRPDSYLPDDPAAPVTADGGVWLEHYAHDRAGRAPADFKGYDGIRDWKRKLHAELGTRYLETSFGDIQRYHFDGEEPGIARVLVDRLKAAGKTVDDPEWWTNEDTDDLEDEPTRENARLATEINAWMSARRQRAGPPPAAGGTDPFQAALRRLGERVLARYETHLRETGTTDHDGTILAGLAAAESHPGALPWKHLLIDEYQDINPAQAAFLHAIAMPRPDGAPAPTLIGVGDDWQAIFAFQGGDPELIRSGRDPSGRVCSRCEKINLRNGYRFGDDLAQGARRLVTAVGNPDRDVVGRGPDPEPGRPPLAVASCELTAEAHEDIGETTTKATGAVLTVLKHWIPIHESEDGENPDEPLTVLVMGRRRIDVQDPPPESSGRLGLDLGAVNEAAAEYGLAMDYRTIHAAKGSEADYAILIDSGPSMAAMRTEHRALERALEPETGGRTDDEHKLWYVAVTRAKRQAIVLVLDADGGASRATKTLIDGAENGMGTDITGLSTWLAPVRKPLPCPGCNASGDGDGRLECRTTQSGRHMAGCSEWIAGADSCDYTQPACDACGDGMLEIDETGRDYVCRNPGCHARIPACRCDPPRPMVVRRQKSTAKRFWGCWRFGEPDSCRQTRNID